MRTILTLFVAFTLVFAFTLPAHADNRETKLDGDLFAGLKARLVGPAAMSGRIAAVDANPHDPNFIVVGASTGGLWISKNGGLNFEPVFDDKPVASIGAVKIHPKNPDIIWVGTGEGNTRNSTSIGGGVYKSLDGGETFTYMGLKRTERIHRIAVHPDNPDIAYVAALGQLWSENPERGVFRTTDGGKSWKKVLYVDEKTGATDIQMVPGNPSKMFAGMWQFRRWPYQFKSGGPGSGLYVSHDGGDNWAEITEEDGLPKGALGRSAFAISPANPSRIYALIEAEKSALARSDDGGESWSLINQDPDINDRPFYYNDLAVDPKDPNRVYRVGSRVKLSEDGGKTFEYMPAIDCCAASNTVHIDTHAWWINPANPHHMIEGNDGGIAITQDHGKTWRYVENLPLAQFYHIAVDDAEPYNIYGGLQDNGSWKGPSEVWENGGIRNLHWQEVAFGDGFDTIPDPEDHTKGYAMSQGGNLYRWDMNTGEIRFIRPPAKADDDGTLADMRYNWNAGFAQDPFDPATIYYGSQYVHKSTDRGLTWTILSEDLTTNKKEWQTFRKSGGLTPDVTAAENYTTITAIAPSPLEKGVIWVGTDDGRVHITRNGGDSWTSTEGNMVRSEGAAPENSWVPMIAPSPHDAGTAFITMDDHRRGHMKPHAFKVSAYGETWESIIGDGVTGYALSVLQDPEDPNLLFLGTEFGLHVSMDGGASWMKWTAGVPTASVMDMAIQKRESDLVLGTHGRAAFVIDDYSPLRGLKPEILSERFKMLGVSDAQQYAVRQTPSSRFTGNGEFRAETEPYGAMITFIASGDDLPHPDETTERARKIAMREAALAEKPDDTTLTQPSDETEGETPDEGEPAAMDKSDAEEEKSDAKATVVIAENDGTVIRTFKTDIHQGINRIVWNLRRDGLRPVPPGKMPEDGTLPAGMEVIPGTYQVTVKFDGQEATGKTIVKADPRSPYTEDAHRATYAMRLEAMALTEKTNLALERLLDARRDIDMVSTLIEAKLARTDIAGDDDNHPLKQLQKQIADLEADITTIETSFRVPPDTSGIVYEADKVYAKIGRAQFYLGSSNAAPSEAAKQAMAEATRVAMVSVAAVDKFLVKDLANFRNAVRGAGVSLLAQTPVGAE